MGKETAKRLVAHGASVLIGGRDEAKLQSAAAEIGGTSGKVRVLAGDISSPATGAALVESAERHFRRPG
jgi:NAD(P)-dependent dehydrogenase (short-subunit alcohol dehydrogenase family)